MIGCFAGNVTNIQYSGVEYQQNIGFTWDGVYRLTEARTNGVAVERNGYDALDRRAWTWDGTATNWFIYDGAQVVADVNATGGLIRSYTYSPGIDNLLAMTIHSGGPTGTYYFIRDHLASVVAVVNTNGAIVEQYRYDAWGRVLGVYDGSGTPLAESAIGNRYLWNGREYSWKTGLYYFRARYYDPVTGDG